MPSPRDDHARKHAPHGSGDSRLWTLEELDRLLRSAHGLTGTVGTVPESVWWPTFLLTLLDTGRPARALLSVPRESYRNGQLSVGLYLYSLHPHTVRELDQLIRRDPDSDRLFCWPGSLQALATRFRGIAETARLPEGWFALETFRRAGPHLLDQTRSLEWTPKFSSEKPLSGTDGTERIRPKQIPPANRPAAPPENPAEQIRIELVEAFLAWMKQSGRTVDEPSELVPVKAQAPERETAPDTLLAFAEEYPSFRLQIKHGTAYLLKCVAKMLTEFHGKPIQLKDLNAALVLKWMKALLEEGKSPRTVNSHRGSLLCLWRMAAAKGRAPQPPTLLDLPKCQVPINTPLAWSADQIQRLVDVCDGLQGTMQHWPNIRRRDYWFSLILFLYESGARIGAALAIRPTDIDLQERIVTLRSESAKTHTEQPIRVSQECVKALAAILDPSRERVWPCGKCRHELYSRLNQLLTAAGLPTDRKSKFHRIRRTTATQTALHGSLDMAQRQLGHTSPSMTMKYIDPRILRPTQAVDVIPALVRTPEVQTSEGAPQ